MRGMNNIYSRQQYPYYTNPSQYNSSDIYNTEPTYPSQEFISTPMHSSNIPQIQIKDYGPAPFAIDIDEAAKQNKNFRTALWTGNYLQLTLMSIPVDGEIGLEIHPDLDQFIRIEEGQGHVKMGDNKDHLDFQENIFSDYAFIIPAGKWHNLINTGDKPIKLYSIYAPPQHPHGTVHVTKEDSDAEEQNIQLYQEQLKEQNKEQIEEQIEEQNLKAQNPSVDTSYGAEAAKVDMELTLEDILTYAIQDEFLARADYLLAMEKFGEQRPFNNIAIAEENHINYLRSLFARYNISCPMDLSKDYVKNPENIIESLEIGIKKEIENIEMYERFLKENIPRDVKTIFTFLRNASQNHLLAFQRVRRN